MSHLKSRVRKIEQRITPPKKIITLTGTNLTDFDKLIEEHIEKTDCDPSNTTFICLIDRFLPEQD